MSVYVDDMEAPFGRMKMCHMIADTSAELHAMADKIGAARKWLQKGGTRREHYDIALSKKALAIAAGAQAVTQRELAAILRVKENMPVRTEGMSQESIDYWKRWTASTQRIRDLFETVEVKL